jgi:hypothetical protein
MRVVSLPFTQLLGQNRNKLLASFSLIASLLNSVLVAFTIRL